MTSKAKKRLSIASIAIFAGMLIAHVGFTVAWYNGSSNLAVYNMGISLAEKDLEISTDNITFKDSLSNHDLEDWIPNGYSPMSSAFSDEWLSQKSTIPQFTSVYTDVAPEKLAYTSVDDFAISNEGYFQKDLYLRCDSYARVSIDMEKTIIEPNEQRNIAIAERLQKKVYKDQTIEEIVEHLNSIKDSIRFSILVLNDTGFEVTDKDYQYQIFDPNKQGTTSLGGILDIDLDGYYDSFEGKEVIYGEVENADSDHLSYLNALENDEGDTSSGGCFIAAHQKNVQPLDLASSISNGLSIKEEKSLSLDEVDQFSFELQENVSKKIILSVYIEGWDKDSVNYTMYSSFTTDICFKLSTKGKGGN